LGLLTPVAFFQQNMLIFRSRPCFQKILASTFDSLSTMLIKFNPLKFIKMNKAELIEAMANSAKISKADAKKALDAFIETTTKALKKDDRVALVGFGSFSVSKRAARKGRNPQTGKEIQIKAKKVVRFKAGAELSSKVK
jgi:DNA-binding protein HU-beta